jgi:peptidyl-prolyl cis-trans isomerase SurA
LPWIGPKQTLKEFEDVAYSLKPGQTSKPFQSTAGYHIVFMKERKPLESYEVLRPQIKAFLESRGATEKVINDRIDSIIKRSNGKMNAELVMDSLDHAAEAKNSDLSNLIREYHDGLLLYEISNRTVWEKASKDSVGLEKFYKKNKKKYYFDSPRYKGIIYFCKYNEDCNKISSVLKGVEYDQWLTKLRAAFNKDSVIRVKVDRGIFKKGDDANVDSLIFKNGGGKQMKGYPFVGVYGKLLKKKPQNYKDVIGLVTADYQNQLEKEWIEQLRKRYTVEINQDLLKTVNNHSAQ